VNRSGALAPRTPIRGLYAVTPDTADTARLLDLLGAVIDGGARLVQYRNKTADPGLREEQSRALRRITRDRGAALILNDSLDLALAVGADGVHLGRDDPDVATARRAAGPDFLIGASCYDRIELGERAMAAGADYLAFGSAFASGTKPAAVHAPLTLYAEARRRFRCPIVAIGGIRPDNAGQLTAAGVDAVAVIAALFDAADPRAAAAAFASLFAA